MEEVEINDGHAWKILIPDLAGGHFLNMLYFGLVFKFISSKMQSVYGQLKHMYAWSVSPGTFNISFRTFKNKLP